MPKVAAEQLKASVRGELHIGTLRTEISVNTGIEFRLFFAGCAFRLSKRAVGPTRFQPQRKAFSIATLPLLAAETFVELGLDYDDFVDRKLFTDCELFVTFVTLARSNAT